MNAHSAIMTETCKTLSADITIIVHSEDANVTRVLHELCSSAVKRAVGPLDENDHDAFSLGMSNHSGRW